jgi:phosphatidylinositol 4-kinase
LWSGLTLCQVREARNYLSNTLRRESALFDVYLEHLLEVIISKGDVHQVQNTRESDVELAAREIAELLQPLALLMSSNNLAEDKTIDDEIVSLIRDCWFNMVVHGFTASTPRGKAYLNELRVMAIHSQPLVTEHQGEQLESSIDLNTILRRGMNSDHEATQKKVLSELLPVKSSEIRGLSYRKVVFLQAAFLVETLRAQSGDCTKALTYFMEPSMRTGDMSSVMEAINMKVMDTYVEKALDGKDSAFSAPHVAKQLVSILTSCCHRIERVQQVAMVCADRIIRVIPSALCQKSSLFALLELLSLMWVSCLEAETDEYEWKSSFTSARGKVSVQLSDNYNLRKRTLNTLYKKARGWVMSVIDIAPQDVKGLLQSYLSEYDDDGAYGHISLGRSFASEMGGMIPRTDQKLGAIDRHGDCNINAASDFIAQYTTRQEYRYAEALPDHDADWLNFIRINDRRGSTLSKTGKECEDAVTVLAHLEARTRERKYVPIGELRDVLRRAAALLCRSKRDECTIVHYLVGIPFTMFTKQSIKLGISLWLGVINENPRMEPRILTEIAQQWEITVQRKLGIFHDQFL